MTKTQRAAMKRVLEACEQRLPLAGQAAIIDELNNLRAALAEPEPEPVAWASCYIAEWSSRQTEKLVKLTRKAQPEMGYTTPLYTTPPARAIERAHNITGGNDE